MNKELFVKEKWCKGCMICTEFCPKNVLAIENGKVAVKSKDDCIKCNICGKLCPDLAVGIKGGN